MKTIGVALLGCGEVGSGVYSLLTRKGGRLSGLWGTRFELVGVAVRRPAKRRKVRVPRRLLTTHAERLVRDPRVDVVVELVGGVARAKPLVLTALRHGKDVVTANKALLAECGSELFTAAKRAGREILFEASVGGGIPIIKVLREGLAANQVRSIHAIINGTTNYILTQMRKENLDFREALAEAQAHGYAEADPRFDVEGIDAAHKLTILATLAFGRVIPFREVSREGITGLSRHDLNFASAFGYVVKLLAIAKRTPQGIEARVQPTLLRQDHILAKVDGAFNAILLNADEAGEVMLYGRGAGQKPTASAVASDLLDLARNDHAVSGPGWTALWPTGRPEHVRSLSSIDSRYYLRFAVIDRPGVLAKISGSLGRHGVSISDLIQTERAAGTVVPLIVLTHHAIEKQVRAAVREIDRLSVVRAKTQVIRIEE